MDTSRDYGFWEALFDFSFSKFVSVDLVRILYVLAIILVALGVIVSVVGAFFNYGLFFGIFSLAMGVVVFVLWVLGARVMLEVFVVIFRIADYMREIAENTRER